MTSPLHIDTPPHCVPSRVLSPAHGDRWRCHAALRLIAGARQRAEKQASGRARVVSCDEAGYDGFGLQRRLHAMGETVSEMLDRVRVSRIRRPRYGCRTCGSIHQAPAPERPIAKGLVTPGLLAQVLVSKYCDHRPL
jgi:hypothetical protein